MQSLFRNIRRKLLLLRQNSEGHVVSGKLVRYISYAIGEVALIIVGILFALQLNNWNEDRKAQADLELYVVRLAEDVRQAIKNSERTTKGAEAYALDCVLIDEFLKQSDYTSEGLESFERALGSLGIYPEPQIHLGLLGQLLNGDIEIITRDRALADAALKMESQLKFNMSIIHHVQDWQDLAYGTTMKFRGRGGSNGDLLPMSYDLEELKTSPEFTRIYTSIHRHMISTKKFSEQIKKLLEEFLAVLEQYE